VAKKVMERRASDNAYLHKDFHGALSAGIDYLDRRCGEEAVREFLRRFTVSFYAPLIAELKAGGLAALRDHFERIYKLEDGEVETVLTDDELVVRVAGCPAVSHMRRHGYRVARLWHETTETVNAALCEGTPYGAELIEYDDRTGRAVFRFHRRQP